jgi:hypothetical protein
MRRPLIRVKPGGKTSPSNIPALPRTYAAAGAPTNRTGTTERDDAGVDLTQIEARLDELTLPLLLPLRSSKTLDSVAFADLLRLGDELAVAIRTADQVSVRLVGKAWFVFTQMLTEAEHAPSPEPIRDAAWQWQERLSQAFGPHFDAP